MKKVVIVSLAIAATVTLGGGAVAFATTQLAPSPSTIEYSTPETEKSTSETKKVQEVIETTPTSTPVDEATTTTQGAAPAPTSVAAPVQAAPAPVAAPVQAAPAPVQEAPAPVSNEWVDSAGNSYIGNNAVSCANGTAPIKMGGLPARCALTAADLGGDPVASN